jgi:hypothetical protein
MTDFAPLDADDLGVDRIATSPTAFALYENLFAFTEKATGAPVLANNYVVTAMIADSQVTTPKIAAANVTSSRLATGTDERDWVLARIAALTFGAVGALAFAASSGVPSANPGDTVAGSTLNAANAAGSSGGSAFSGTWRCLGLSNGGGTPNDTTTTLWLRVS